MGFSFCVLSLGALYFSWQGVISILPVASILLGIYSRWQEKPLRYGCTAS